MPSAAMGSPSTGNYDYLRRKNSALNPNVQLTRDNSFRRQSSPAVTVSPIREGRTADFGGRSPTGRVSNGTVDSDVTVSTTSAQETIHTTLTEPPAYSVKLVVVGDGGCGKTCLLISYAEGHFPEKYVPTVFENYITITPHPESCKSVELALWDTAGQEEYDRLRPLSYPETDLLFVCFAIDCPNSLENVSDKWYPEVLHFCPTTPVILCGLKSDLRFNTNCINLLKAQGLSPITPAQGKEIADKMGAAYMECSAKEREGVEDIFDKAIILATSDKDHVRGGMSNIGGLGNARLRSSSTVDGKLGRVLKVASKRRFRMKRACRLL